MILSNYEALTHYKALIQAYEDTGKYVHPTETSVKGGYWKEGSVCMAFDNATNDCFIEQFDNVVEAIKYANGIEALTIEGYYI